MKKIILLSLTTFIFISCGAPESDETIDGVPSLSHRLFVSSQTYNGSLGGLDGADAKCDSLAKAAGLKKTYKAILSSSSLSAYGRLLFTGEILKVSSSDNSILIADSGADLFNTDTTDLKSLVNLDESGNTISSNVWTGTGSDGSNLSDNCNNWASSSGSVDAWHGDSTKTNERWLESNFTSCNNNYSLYCVSQ